MRFLLHSRPLTSGTLVRFEVREERLLQCIGTPPGVAGEKRNKLRSQKPQSTSRRIVLHKSLCTHNWSRWTGRLRRYTMRTPPRAKHRSTRVYTCNGYSLYLCGICKPVQTLAAPYLSLVMSRSAVRVRSSAILFNGEHFWAEDRCRADDSVGVG
jgi:hypothetical protein